MNQFIKNVSLLMGGFILGGLTTQRAITKAIRSREPLFGTSPNKLEYDHNLVFDTQGDAESVLNTMIELISAYGSVSVSELYDLASVACTTYTANKYGWKNLNSAKVISVHNGYFLKLPKIECIK